MNTLNKITPPAQYFRFPLKGGGLRGSFGFTLVELIVVISILAILGTIAFLSFGGFSSKARDGSRISDTTSLSKGLELYSVQAGKYPTPENISGTGIIGTTPVAYLGTIQNQISTLTKISKTPKDPLSNNYYIYGTTVDLKQYQIATTLENSLSYNSPLPLGEGLGVRAYADSPTYQARVTGNYKGLIKFNSGTTAPITIWIANIPSLIYNSGANLLSQETLYSINKSTNLPYLIKDSIQGNLTPNQILPQLTGTQATLTGINITDITTQTGIIENSTTLLTLGYDLSLIEKIILGTSSTSSTPPPTPTYTCSGALILANANISNNTNLTQDTAYQTTNSANNCYYACKLGYSGTNCENKEVFGDEDTDSIAACNSWVQNAIGTSAGGYQNWIWVPARNFTTDGVGTPLTDEFYKRSITYNSVNYICKGFAVMKYEAKFVDTTGKTQPDLSRKSWAVSDYLTDNDTFSENLTNGIVSKATDYPIGQIRQGEAIDACKGLTYNSKESHLITNNEWMGITRNIEAKNENWTNGTVGNGGIYRGNVNLTDDMSYSAYQASGNTIYLAPSAGSDTDPRGTNTNGNRRLILSNNSNIWDISGNVWEHVNKSNLPTTSNLRTTNSWNSSTERISNSCGANNWYAFSDGETTPPAGGTCTYTNGYSYANIGPTTPNLNSNNGIGRIYSYNTVNNIFRRGGDALNVAYSGIFTLYLYRSAATQGANVGVRCSL